jgi:hypothetical protein
MKRNKVLSLVLAVLFIIVAAQGVHAITVTATPNPANTGQNVAIMVNSTYFAPGPFSCALQINFGDGSPVAGVGTCTVTPCTLVTNHVYATPGVYTITAGSSPFTCGLLPAPPNPATTAITITPAACPALNITSPASLPPGTVGQFYSVQIQASGGQPPLSFSLISGALPPGLSLSPNGIVSGIPAAVYNDAFSVRVTDSCPPGAQTAQKGFAMVVNPAPCPTLNIPTPAALPAGTSGQPYTYQLQTSGGVAPVTFSLVEGSLPPGLSIGSTGLITGTTSVTGTYTFMIRAADSCALAPQTVQKIFSLAMTPAACPALNIVSPATLSAGTSGQPYTYQLQTSGGVAPVTFSLVEGSLPPGLTLGTNGLISGIPSVSGNYSFAVRASDSCVLGALSVQRTFSLVITPAACPALNIISPATLPAGTAGQAYTYQLQTSGGVLPVTFSLVSGSLPPGLTLGTNGLISGIPSSAGNYSFTLNTADNCPTGVQSAQRTFSITIQEVLPPPVQITVRTTPSSFKIPRGQSSALPVLYVFSSGTQNAVSLNSPRGQFLVGNESVGDNPVPLTATVQNGGGTISEVVSIPVAVVERAIRNNANRFFYTRVFANATLNITLAATTEFLITTEAGGTFQIQRIDLYFENRRPEITVERNYPGLRAFADIRFIGSGFLRGFWEVDGRRLSEVNQHLLYGNSITIETPDIPSLPTFDTGYHFVRFVITDPPAGIPLQEIFYFVTIAESPWKPVSIKLYAPENGANIERAAATFSWEEIRNATTFAIRFYTEMNEAPIFSAFTKEASYTIPALVLVSTFQQDRSYAWKVTGYDNENKITGESEFRKFSFKKSDEYVKGQILAVFPTKVFPWNLVNDLEKTYQMDLLRTYTLRALDATAVIFGTGEKDIVAVIGELKKNKDILFVQPNYIFRTLTDPLSKNQYANMLLRTDRLHEVAKGRGIRIALIDTGVDAGHEDLKSRITDTRNFVQGEDYIPEIHGTAIAGVIAAEKNGVGIEGVAPEASIIALRACRQMSAEKPEGVCRTDTLSEAIDEAVVQGVHIINMSFGTAYPDNLLAGLIDKGRKKGILFLAPAGNMNSDRKLRFPASHPAVISVAGLDEKLNPYPNAGIVKESLVSAPAFNILTTVPGNKYNFMNGTSLSTAYVSGILALALEKDKSITKETIPAYKGDLCKWEEELLKIKICDK